MQENIVDNYVSPYRSADVDDFLLKTRRINLCGDVNDDLAWCVINQLQYYSQNKLPVYIYISTPGGSWSAGHAIIDQILLSSFKVYTIVRGEALSMGALIAAYGTKGCRCITRGSSMLLHSMVVDSFGTDAVSNYKNCSDFWNNDYKDKMKYFSQRTKLSVKDWLRILEQDLWISSSNAIKYGIIDKIWTKQDEMAIKCVE